jgi:hypothetical protein
MTAIVEDSSNCGYYSLSGTFAGMLRHTHVMFIVRYISDTPYNTTLTSNCEPWFMASRFMNPEYDVRFRGYGKLLENYGLNTCPEPCQVVLYAISDI